MLVSPRLRLTVVPPTLTEIENALHMLESKKAAHTRGDGCNAYGWVSDRSAPCPVHVLGDLVASKAAPEWRHFFQHATEGKQLYGSKQVGPNCGVVCI